MATRKTPPHPIRIVGRQVRTTTAPAFGKIPTFSNRLPTRKPRLSSLAAASHARAREVLACAEERAMCDTSDVHAPLAASAAAQIRSRVVPHTTSHVVIDIHSATPNALAPSPPHPAGPPSTRTHKQIHRTVSICPISPSSGATPPAFPSVAPPAVQRPPTDLCAVLSVPSGLSLALLPRSASIEEVAVTEASSRAATDHRPAHTAVPTHSMAFTSSLSLAPPPSADYHAAQQLAALPPYPRRHAQQPAGETPAQRLKRLYLCPWEGTSPRSARKVAATVTGSGEQRLALDGSAGSAGPARRTKRWILGGAAALVALILVVDLVVLNVRVLTLRDAYYDE
ncbi:hypothetical protein JCM3770_002048 [Rhodotorula araucariae]